MTHRELEARARLAKVEADPDHPHRDAVTRSLRRIMGDEPHTDHQIDRIHAAILDPRAH